MITRRHFFALLLGIIGIFGCKSGPAKNRSKAIPIGNLRDLKEGPNYFLIERVVITKHGSELTALSLVCTHQECLLNPVSGGGFTCPCHGSAFDSKGNVLNGPASKNLINLPVSVDEFGIVKVEFQQSS